MKSLILIYVKTYGNVDRNKQGSEGKSRKYHSKITVMEPKTLQTFIRYDIIKDEKSCKTRKLDQITNYL